jgi:hypothetical protein
MHMSGGGGCCDCGDPEAWKQHHSCTLHSSTAGQVGTTCSSPLSKGWVGFVVFSPLACSHPREQTPEEQLALVPERLRGRLFELLSILVTHCGEVLCRFPENDEPVPADKYGAPACVCLPWRPLGGGGEGGCGELGHL